MAESYYIYSDWQGSIKIMPGTSSKTKPIAFRLPNEVHAILARRADKQGKKVGEYVRKRVSYDTCRSHKKVDKQRGMNDGNDNC